MIESDASRVLQASREELLSVKEYSALFRVNCRSVYTAIQQERLPYPVVRPLGGVALILVPSVLVAKLRAA